MTPEIRSPSLPENSPYRMSSSASRRRCSMICFAVVAAIRPKPSGVSSYSPILAPSSSSSAAYTVTCPLLRSSSTRASSTAPGVLWYAVSSACSIASTRTSKEISFSRSSVRRIDRSMSMSSGLLRRGPVELDLDQRLRDRVVRQPLRNPGDVEHDTRVVARADPAGDLAAVVEARRDQPVVVASPVARLRERAVDPARGDLEGVGLLPHQIPVVELMGHGPG